jgi:hypothetical protein
MFKLRLEYLDSLGSAVKSYPFEHVSVGDIDVYRADPDNGGWDQKSQHEVIEIGTSGQALFWVTTEERFRRRHYWLATISRREEDGPHVVRELQMPLASSTATLTAATLDDVNGKLAISVTGGRLFVFDLLGGDSDVEVSWEDELGQTSDDAPED